MPKFLADALQLVHVYAERGSPKFEKAALRWLERYLAEGSPRLQHFTLGWPQTKRQRRRIPVGSFTSIRAVQSWDVKEIEAPEGTRRAEALETVDGARAIIIRLAPGEELGDHQVRVALDLALEPSAEVCSDDAKVVDDEAHPDRELSAPHLRPVNFSAKLEALDR